MIELYELNLHKMTTPQEKAQCVSWWPTWSRDQHRLGSKLTRVILLCPWEKRFTALFPAWWSWQAVLN